LGDRLSQYDESALVAYTIEASADEFVADAMHLLAASLPVVDVEIQDRQMEIQCIIRGSRIR
jgi:hypothetical protein